MNGVWCNAAEGKTFKVYNPANKELLGSVPDCDIFDMNKAVEAAANSNRTSELLDFFYFMIKFIILKSCHPHSY